MKFFIIAFTVISSLCCSKTFAGDITVTPAVMQSFQNDFYKAKNVTWSVVNNWYKAEFLLQGRQVSTFYDRDGFLVAMAQNMTTFELPKALRAALQKEMEENWISGLFSITSEEGTSYFVTLENASSKRILKATANKWKVLQTSEK